MHPRALRYSLLVTGLCLVPGCTPTQPRPEGNFRATDTPSQVHAIVNAAQAEDDRSLTELVHALTDEDAAIRLFAIQSLHERTGQTLGYGWTDPIDERRAAVVRWHDWLTDQGIAPRPIVTGYDAPPTDVD